MSAQATERVTYPWRDYKPLPATTRARMKASALARAQREREARAQSLDHNRFAALVRT